MIHPKNYDLHMPASEQNRLCRIISLPPNLPLSPLPPRVFNSICTHYVVKPYIDVLVILDCCK